MKLEIVILKVTNLFTISLEGRVSRLWLIFTIYVFRRLKGGDLLPGLWTVNILIFQVSTWSCLGLCVIALVCLFLFKWRKMKELYFGHFIYHTLVAILKWFLKKITFIPDIQCKTKLLKMKHEACIVPNNPSVKVGVGKLVERFLKQAATWTTIYLWGYFALSPGWLFAPLILSVLRWVWDQIWYCSRKMKLKVN